MAVEAAAVEHSAVVEPFVFEVRSIDNSIVLSVLPTIRDLVRVCGSVGSQAPLYAARFHETVARMLAEGARIAARQRNIRRIALSGGCFANRRLLARLIELLEDDEFTVLYQRAVPCGDGGLALGQAFVAAWSAADSARAGRS